jgi:hypothetical protein
VPTPDDRMAQLAGWRETAIFDLNHHGRVAVEGRADAAGVLRAQAATSFLKETNRSP